MAWRRCRGVDDVQFIGIRRFIGATLGYKDRNDGFARSYHSRNKVNRSRIYKTGKLNRKRLRRAGRERDESLALQEANDAGR